MDKFLVHTLTIQDHPIKKLKEIYQRQYILALGEFLCYITDNDRTSKLVFEIWSQSIIGKTIKESWSFTYEYKKLKNGLSYHRDGITFSTMRQSLLFDCFYLLEKSNKSSLKINGYTFLLDKVCGFFTKSSINYVISFFKGENAGDKFPDVLRRHRRQDSKFCDHRIKRVLVVATMSAGKSTLINALVGHKINRVRSTACTSRVHYIYNKPSLEGALAFFGDRRLVYSTDYSVFQNEIINAIGVNFASTLSKQRICFIDTPGVNYNGDKTHEQITKTVISQNNYDILLLVLNGEQLGVNDENALIDFISQNCKRKIICVINKSDSFKKKQDSIEDALSLATDMLREHNIKANVVPISGEGAFLIRHANEPSWLVSSDDMFEFEEIKKKLMKPYYNLPTYIPGVPKDLKIESALERTCIPYLENLILKI